MNIQTLRTFIAINRYGTLTEAARCLNITQSALSRTIRQMEEEIGSTLFNHQGNRLSLNGSGVKFLSMAENIIRHYDNTVKEIQEDNSLFDRSIRIAVSSAGVNVPAIIHGFRKLHPETWFSLRAYEAENQNNDIQFTLYCTVDKSEEADSVFLGEEELFLTVSLANPIARKESVALSSLSSEHFLFADSDNDMQSIQMHYCRLAGFEPDFDNIVSKQMLMLLLIELDEGITLLPRIETVKFAQIPISDMHCTRFVYLKRNTQIYETRLARDFEAYCIRYFREKGSPSFGEAPDAHSSSKAPV